MNHPLDIWRYLIRPDYSLTHQLDRFYVIEDGFDLSKTYESALRRLGSDMRDVFADGGSDMLRKKLESFWNGLGPSKLLDRVIREASWDADRCSELRNFKPMSEYLVSKVKAIEAGKDALDLSDSVFVQ